MSEENTELVEKEITTISHHTMLDLLRVTYLVYDYGKNFKIKNKQDTIETFVSELQENHELENLKLSDSRKEILVEIAENVPTGKLYKFINNAVTDIQVGVAVSEGKKRATVVFRGSESMADWYYDLMVFKHKLVDNVCVHSGFYKQLTMNSVYDELVISIKNILKEHNDFDVYVTGHSLGGALSTLFGYMLSKEIENNVKVVSFASPRVGNYAWKKSFEEQKNLTHYRITNKRDIVTAFPIYKYYHVGINIQLSDNKYKLCEDSSNKKWYEETIFTCWNPYEHFCDLYYKRLTDNTW